MQPQRRQPTSLPRPWDSPFKNTGVGCHFLLQSMKVKRESEVAQSCPTLSDPKDCNLPVSSVHGIFQARVLEWGAIAFSMLNLTLLKMQYSPNQSTYSMQCLSKYQLTWLSWKTENSLEIKNYVTVIFKKWRWGISISLKPPLMRNHAKLWWYVRSSGHPVLSFYNLKQVSLGKFSTW